MAEVNTLGGGGVSVLATVFNERATIDRWLESLAAQTRRPDEVVIVDAGSSDGTLERLDAWGGRLPLEVVVAEGANVPQGRNVAFDHTRFEILAITDAGTIAEPDWLERLVAPLEADPDAGVSAGFFRPHGETWFERLLAVVITPRWAEVDPATYLPSSRSVAVRRSWWVRSGGYPGWLRAGEDLVFSMRLRASGAPFVMAPDAIVRWRPRPTLRSFFKQYRHYARGDGHGHLWVKRHAARYAAYAVGTVLLCAGLRWRPAARFVLAAGFAAYMRKFWWRVYDEGGWGGPTGSLAALVLTPVIVVTGDVGKMIGYPQGLLERHRAGDPEALAEMPIASHRLLGDG